MRISTIQRTVLGLVGGLVLTGGGLALEPSPEYLSLSIGKAGIRTLALSLFESLKEKGIHVATVTVAALVSPGSKDATAVAEPAMQQGHRRC